MVVIVRAAQNKAIEECIRDKFVKLPKVLRPLVPPIRAPKTTNIAAIIVAFLYFIKPLTTGGPKRFAASFAPKDQPKKIAGKM
jgi:hypothetical protein